MPDDARYTNAPEMCLDKGKPPNFARKLRQLFAAMSISGSTFGVHDIHYLTAASLPMTKSSNQARGGI